MTAQTVQPRPPCPGTGRPRKEPRGQRASGLGATKGLRLLRGARREARRAWRGPRGQRTPVLAGRCPGRGREGPAGLSPALPGGTGRRGRAWEPSGDGHSAGNRQAWRPRGLNRAARPAVPWSAPGRGPQGRPRRPEPGCSGSVTSGGPSCRAQGSSVRADAPSASALCASLGDSCHPTGGCSTQLPGLRSLWPPSPSPSGQQLKTEAGTGRSVRGGGRRTRRSVEMEDSGVPRGLRTTPKPAQQTCGPGWTSGCPGV